MLGMLVRSVVLLFVIWWWLGVVRWLVGVLIGVSVCVNGDSFMLGAWCHYPKNLFPPQAVELVVLDWVPSELDCEWGVDVVRRLVGRCRLLSELDRA